MMQMLFILMLIMGFIFIQLNHPMAMGLVLLLQTVLVCLSIGLIAETFWFSYILFLIFLGGMLVLFIYMTSLASNEMFSLSINMFLTSTGLIFMIMLLMIIMDKTFMLPFLENLEMQSSKILVQENLINLNKIYNMPTNMITVMLIIYLLITLVASVKITNVFSGPLRHSN